MRQVGGAKIAVLRDDGGECHLAPSRKNGDESSTEAAAAAKTPVVDRVRARVSHAAGLEASPTSRSEAAVVAAVGLATPGDRVADDDLGGGRFAGRTIRGRPRVLCHVLRIPEAAGQDLGGFSKGPRTPADVPVAGVGPGSSRPDSRALCRTPAD